MPRKRLSAELWKHIRRQVWERDGGMCQYPYGAHPVALADAHIDHIISGKRGTNALSNLRTLCRYHHVLRADQRHRGMLAQALANGLIPANWRVLVWDEPAAPDHGDPSAEPAAPAPAFKFG